MTGEVRPSLSPREQRLIQAEELFKAFAKALEEKGQGESQVVGIGFEHGYSVITPEESALRTAMGLNRNRFLWNGEEFAVMYSLTLDEESERALTASLQVGLFMIDRNETIENAQKLINKTVNGIIAKEIS